MAGMNRRMPEPETGADSLLASLADRSRNVLGRRLFIFVQWRVQGGCVRFSAKFGWQGAAQIAPIPKWLAKRSFRRIVLRAIRRTARGCGQYPPLAGSEVVLVMRRTILLRSC